MSYFGTLYVWKWFNPFPFSLSPFSSSSMSVYGKYSFSVRWTHEDLRMTMVVVVLLLLEGKACWASWYRLVFWLVCRLRDGRALVFAVSETRRFYFSVNFGFAGWCNRLSRNTFSLSQKHFDTHTYMATLTYTGRTCCEAWSLWFCNVLSFLTYIVEF